MRNKDEKWRENEHLVAMGASAAVLAHEMSNQLNTVSFATQLIEQHLTKQQGCEDKAVLSLLPCLKRGLDQLGCLLEEFRSLGRPQRLSLQPTNLVRLITELISSLQAQYATHGVCVQLDAPPHLPSIAVDQQKFRQALLNLFKNAVEAMPQGGVLAVRVYRSRRIVCVEVQDSGMGIPEGVDIFEPFATTKSGGTGLGMAVVRQVVSAHGGAVTYTSQPGKGTTFRLTLPIDVAKHSAKEFSIFSLPQLSSIHRQQWRIAR
ncbi:MAG: sensor histidine kinase [Candidatus Binatia bacterium]